MRPMSVEVRRDIPDAGGENVSERQPLPLAPVDVWPGFADGPNAIRRPLPDGLAYARRSMPAKENRLTPTFSCAGSRISFPKHPYCFGAWPPRLRRLPSGKNISRAARLWSCVGEGLICPESTSMEPKNSNPGFR